MRAIKHVLTERYYLWEDAHKLARIDPDIDLSGQGEAYVPYRTDNSDILEPEDPALLADKNSADSPPVAK